MICCLTCGDVFNKGKNCLIVSTTAGWIHVFEVYSDVNWAQPSKSRSNSFSAAIRPSRSASNTAVTGGGATHLKVEAQKGTTKSGCSLLKERKGQQQKNDNQRDKEKEATKKKQQKGGRSLVNQCVVKDPKRLLSVSQCKATLSH